MKLDLINCPSFRSGHGEDAHEYLCTSCIEYLQVRPERMLPRTQTTMDVSATRVSLELAFLRVPV
jgi:hypothetical protein